MAQSSFQFREFLDSVKRVTTESDERARHVLHQASDCREIIRRTRNVLNDSRQSITEHPTPSEKHGLYQYLTRAQALALYDKATDSFLRSWHPTSRREVIELHQLLERLK